MSSSPDVPDSRDELEVLLAGALAAHEAGGNDAVAAFLAAHPRQQTRLQQALLELHRAGLLDASPAEPEPAVFGEFRVTGRLGAGGMGVVYAARQTTLERDVALKVVRPELLVFEGARERFRREIDAVARLEHPAIVPILATGQDRGVPYYAMPLLPGCSGDAVLRAFAARGPAGLRGEDLQRELTRHAPGAAEEGSRDAFAGAHWQVCVRAVRQAALGIQHAHTRGVLHRDLKPSNLMLLPDGRAVVLDFGLAQARGDARLTQAGSAAGSPAYMAPEQVRGDAVDERTDVYGLGATLHALIGLRPPFALANAEQLRQRILSGDREPLRNARELPPELHLVLATAMDVDAARRYASAAALAADLQAVLEQRPIAAQGLPWSVRARRFAQRHRTGVASAGAALLALAAMPPVLLWQSHVTNDRLAAEARRTSDANVRLQAQIERADRSVTTSLDAIDAMLGRVANDRVRNTPAMQHVAVAMLDDALALCARVDGDAPEPARVRSLRQRVLVRLARQHAALGEFAAAAAAAQELRTALAERRELAPADHLDAGRAEQLLAFLAARHADAAAATAAAAAAHRHFEQAATSPAESQAARQELAGLAELEAKLAEDRGDGAEAERVLRQGLAEAERSLAAGAGAPRLVAMLRLALAAYLHRAGDRQGAKELAAAVMAMFPDLTQPESGWPVPRLQVAQAEYELATVLVDDGDGAIATDYFAAARARLDDLVRDYPADPTVRRLRGRVCNQLGNEANAAKNFAAARVLLEQGCADELQALASNPADEPALAALASLRRSLTTTLRAMADWPALERVARELGAMPPRAEVTGRAARELLRCAEAVPQRSAQLRADALTLLERAVAVGLKVDANDELYAPLRSDPRFQALLAPAANR